jgi:hypothetical protein
LEAVLGRDLGHLSFDGAWLHGFRVERAAGYSFPLLVADPDESVEGTLTFGLSDLDRHRIAYFEDSEYEQRSFEVRHTGGRTIAIAYAASNTLASSGERWDLAQFQRDDRALLVAITRFVMREHYGITPQDEMERLWGSVRDRIARELELAGKP